VFHRDGRGSGGGGGATNSQIEISSPIKTKKAQSSKIILEKILISFIKFIVKCETFVIPFYYGSDSVKVCI
jgi:hypothetical protein